MSVYRNVVVVLLLTFPAFVRAETGPTTEKADVPDQSPSNSQRGKHSIQISIGLLSKVGDGTQISPSGVTTSVDGNGFIGSLAYGYWFDHDLAINVSVGVLGSDVSTSVSGSEISTDVDWVVPVLFGLKYQPMGFVASDVLKPYVAASVGPLFGSAVETRTGVNVRTETFTETALASRLGVGVDTLLSKSFTLGLRAGYYLVTDFDRPVGGEKNYSSPELSLSLGIVFGGGKK